MESNSGMVSAKTWARAIILGAIERELHEYHTGGDCDPATNRLIDQLEKERDRLQQRWGFDS